MRRRHAASALRLIRNGSPSWRRRATRTPRRSPPRDLGLVFQTNTIFHRKLFEGTDNPYLSEAIETSNAKTHGIRSHGLGMPSLLEKARAEHFAMVDAVRNGDLEELARLCTSHMQPARAFYEEKYCGAL